MDNVANFLSSSEIENSISRAIDFLVSNQLPDGEFKTYVARGNNPKKEYKFDSTVFNSSLVLYSLSFLATPQVEKMRSKALNFLEAEMESTGTWRFWSSKNPSRRIIPPDMDDTCCISFILKKYGKAPKNLDLILGSRNKQGLFYTWFLPNFSNLRTTPTFWFRSLLETPIRFMFWRKTEADRDDIDGGVNANVLLYLGENEDTKPAIDYLIDITLNGKEESCDKWYLTKFPFYYLLSRAYFNGIESLGVVKSKVIETLAEREKDLLSNPLDAALAACTMLNFGYSSPLLDKIIKLLIKEQEEDGAWVRIALYYGGPKKYYGWGSRELTTGFCIESLTRYKQLVK